MNVNDGGGLYTSSGLFDSVLVELDQVEVKGVSNMAKVIDAMQKISALRDSFNELNEKLEKLQNGREEGPGNDSED